LIVVNSLVTIFFSMEDGGVQFLLLFSIFKSYKETLYKDI